jgi:membrane-associated phospholipid phosphatase
MCTAIFAAGIFLYPMLHVEQLLVQRPITGVDCVFSEWARLGEIDGGIFFTLILGIVCLLLGYRRRVLPYLLLLLLLGVGVEYVGKQVFPQPVPDRLNIGLISLRCPQLSRQPRSVCWSVAVGMWWEAPKIPARRIEIAHYAAIAPLIIDDDATINYGYPSGHALRWSFLGLVACWLCQRHIRRRLPRTLLMVLTLLITFGGGFAQFYIGNHLGTDVIGGYLLGLSAACCAIGLLQRNQKQRVMQPPIEPIELLDKQLEVTNEV